jgi:DNA-binding IclR family transcriptional regulator
VKTQRCNYQIVREAVDELAEETSEQAQFASEDCWRLFDIYLSTSDSDLGGRFHPAIERPLHCTALGKAILASMPQERVDEIIDRY